MAKKAEHVTPKIGSQFEKKYGGKQYVLTVISEGGQTMFLLGKFSYRSPSAAAKTITGGEVNGWRFWSID
jgi:hypothetical protein